MKKFTVELTHEQLLTVERLAENQIHYYKEQIEKIDDTLAASTHKEDADTLQDTIKRAAVSTYKEGIDTLQDVIKQTREAREVE